MKLFCSQVQQCCLMIDLINTQQALIVICVPCTLNSWMMAWNIWNKSIGIILKICIGKLWKCRIYHYPTCQARSVCIDLIACMEFVATVEIDIKDHALSVKSIGHPYTLLRIRKQNRFKTCYRF